LANDRTAHAEVVAIRQACEKLKSVELKGCELYTSCEPCPMCLGAIYWAHISRIYFGAVAKDASEAGFDDSAIYQQFALERSKRSILMVQMMRQEALAAFHAWTDQPNKIRY
jgi:tRNA(Arg) A34 adenosine deaminase TadA